MKKVLIAVVSLAIITVSCRTKAKNEGPIQSLGDLKEAGEKIKEATDASASKWKARQAKGDTMALPYKDLEAYLPDISGYTKDGEPKGSQMSMPGMGSYSQAEQRYKNGEKEIKVEIVDYNGASQLFSGATALYKMGYATEDDTKKEAATDLGIKDISAYETIYKKEQRGQIAVIAGDRFMIQIESNGSNDPDLLHTVAKSMKLSDLASK
jgi:hypothetical protein